MNGECNMRRARRVSNIRIDWKFVLDEKIDLVHAENEYVYITHSSWGHFSLSLSHTFYFSHVNCSLCDSNGQWPVYRTPSGSLPYSLYFQLGPDQRGIEQSITVIISFHNTFITKVYQHNHQSISLSQSIRSIEHSELLVSTWKLTKLWLVDSMLGELSISDWSFISPSTDHFSQLPTTDLIDTAKMPLCTYSVRRDSITGPVVQYAVVGETVFHVWQCESGKNKDRLP